MCLDHIDYTHTCPFTRCEACEQLPLRAFLACQAPFLFSHKYLLLFLSTANVFVGFSKIELCKAQRSHWERWEGTPVLLRVLHGAVCTVLFHCTQRHGSVIGGTCFYWQPTCAFPYMSFDSSLFSSELVLMLSLHFHGYHVDQKFM